MGTKSSLNVNTQKLIRAEENSILKATIEVIPNSAYRAKGVYQCSGLGIYSGKYYATKVTHTINATGYAVIIEANKQEQPGVGSGSGTIGSGEVNSSPVQDTRAGRSQESPKVYVDMRTGEVNRG